MDSVLMCFIVLLMCLAVEVYSIPLHGAGFEPHTRPYRNNGLNRPQNKKSEMANIVSEHLVDARDVQSDAYVYNRAQSTLNHRLLSDSRTKRLKRIRRSLFDTTIIVHEGKKNPLTRCDPHAERHYCHNNGVCSYIPSLELKTCRCPMKYTGPRCGIWDIQYLISEMTPYNFFMYGK